MCPTTTARSSCSARPCHAFSSAIPTRRRRCSRYVAFAPGARPHPARPISCTKKRSREPAPASPVLLARALDAGPGVHLVARAKANRPRRGLERSRIRSPGRPERQGIVTHGPPCVPSRGSPDLRLFDDDRRDATCKLHASTGMVSSTPRIVELAR